MDWFAETVAGTQEGDATPESVTQEDVIEFEHDQNGMFYSTINELQGSNAHSLTRCPLVVCSIADGHGGWNIMFR